MHISAAAPLRTATGAYMLRALANGCARALKPGVQRLALDQLIAT